MSITAMEDFDFGKILNEILKSIDNLYGVRDLETICFKLDANYYIPIKDGMYLHKKGDDGFYFYYFCHYVDNEEILDFGKYYKTSIYMFYLTTEDINVDMDKNSMNFDKLLINLNLFIECIRNEINDFTLQDLNIRNLKFYCLSGIRKRDGLDKKGILKLAKSPIQLMGFSKNGLPNHISEQKLNEVISNIQVKHALNPFWEVKNYDLKGSYLLETGEFSMAIIAFQTGFEIFCYQVLKILYEINSKTKDYKRANFRSIFQIFNKYFKINDFNEGNKFFDEYYIDCYRKMRCEIVHGGCEFHYEDASKFQFVVDKMKKKILKHIKENGLYDKFSEFIH